MDMPGNIVRITRKFSLEMAHALYRYKGSCRNIHGHSYKLSVTIKGVLHSNKNNNEDGMVMDFKKMKELVNSCIIEQYDHALVLNSNSELAHKLAGANAEEKIIMADYQPTCENLLIEFVKILIRALPQGVSLHHVCLQETAESYAEWYKEDNYYVK